MAERRSRAIAWRLVLLVALVGCAPPVHPIDPATRPMLDARDVLKFQFDGYPVAIRAVRYSGDSLSGTASPDTLGSRHSYPIAAVSQAEVERHDDPARTTSSDRFFVVTFLLLALVGLQHAFAHYGGSGS